MRGVEPHPAFLPSVYQPTGRQHHVLSGRSLFLEGDASRTAKMTRSTRQRAHTSWREREQAGRRRNHTATSRSARRKEAQRENKGETSFLNRGSGARRTAPQKWHQRPKQVRRSKRVPRSTSFTTTLVDRPLLLGSRTLFSAIVTRQTS